MKKQPILLFDLEGNFLEDIESMQECADKIGSEISAVSSACAGRILSVNNFQVRKSFLINPLKIGDITSDRAKTIIVGKYWNDNLVCVYQSINQASIKNNINAGQISDSIKSGYKCNGFIFKELI